MIWLAKGGPAHHKFIHFFHFFAKLKKLKRNWIHLLVDCWPGRQSNSNKSNQINSIKRNLIDWLIDFFDCSRPCLASSTNQWNIFIWFDWFRAGREKSWNQFHLFHSLKRMKWNDFTFLSFSSCCSRRVELFVFFSLTPPPRYRSLPPSNEFHSFVLRNCWLWAPRPCGEMREKQSINLIQTKERE